VGGLIGLGEGSFLERGLPLRERKLLSGGSWPLNWRVLLGERGPREEVLEEGSSLVSLGGRFLEGGVSASVGGWGWGLPWRECFSPSLRGWGEGGGSAYGVVG
jgi:hypothetical protein